MFPFFSKSLKIEVFVRHCYYSNASAHKKRFALFSHQKCFQNLLQTIDPNKVNCTILLDTHFSKGKKHFVHQQNRFPVVEIDAGCESGSFLALLDYVKKQKFPKRTILYFLEDDYLHREGWAEILLEGFSLPIDYVTLFDHKDKYFSPSYESLQSTVFHTSSCHWRTTPSTTNTYAMRMQTLEMHQLIHQAYSEGINITADHAKFIALQEMGATLISSIPGWSTHAEPEFASPAYQWEQLLEKDPQSGL